MERKNNKHSKGDMEKGACHMGYNFESRKKRVGKLGNVGFGVGGSGKVDIIISELAGDKRYISG